MAVILVYFGIFLCLVGIVSVAKPLRFLGVRTRFAGAGILLFGLYAKLGTAIFPPIDRGQFMIRMKGPTGTRIERTEELAQEATRLIREELGNQNVSATVGYIGIIPTNYPVQGPYQWMSGPEEAILRVALRRGSGLRVDELKEELMGVLRGSFRPEFINRIDEIIVFRALTDEQLVQITKLLLDRLERRLRAQGIEVVFTDEAIELLAHEGFDPEFGARPLRRTIQRLVENELSRMVLSDAIAPGDRVTVDALEGELRFDVDTDAARELEEAGERRVSAEPATR